MKSIPEPDKRTLSQNTKIPSVWKRAGSRFLSILLVITSAISAIAALAAFAGILTPTTTEETNWSPAARGVFCLVYSVVALCLSWRMEKDSPRMRAKLAGMGLFSDTHTRNLPASQNRRHYEPDAEKDCQ